MKLVWSYAKVGSFCDIEYSQVERYYFIASVISFSTLFPDATRVLRCNQEFKQLVCNWELEGLFDEIECVDYQAELFKRYCVKFFAYPKLDSMLHQEEPYWILDTDRVVLDKADTVDLFLRNFDAGSYYGEIYTHRFPYPHTNVSFKPGTKKQEYPKYLKEFFDKRTGINGGVIYYPEPVVAKLIPLTIFSLIQNLNTKGKYEGVDPTNLHFLYYEEVPILRVLEILGKKVVDIGQQLTFLSHPDLSWTLKDLIKMLLKQGNSNKTSILGLKDPMDIIYTYKKAFDVKNNLELLDLV